MKKWQPQVEIEEVREARQTIVDAVKEYKEEIWEHVGHLDGQEYVLHPLQTYQHTLLFADVKMYASLSTDFAADLGLSDPFEINDLQPIIAEDSCPLEEYEP